MLALDEEGAQSDSVLRVFCTLPAGSTKQLKVTF